LWIAIHDQTENYGCVFYANVEQLSHICHIAMLRRACTLFHPRAKQNARVSKRCVSTKQPPSDEGDWKAPVLIAGGAVVALVGWVQIQ